MSESNKILNLAAVVLLQCLCLFSTLGSAATLPPTPTSSTPAHLARRQLSTVSPTFDVPAFATDVSSTITTVTTFIIIIWVVSILGSVCVLCAIGYCILSYTRRQKEKSRMAKEKHQMEMDAWRQQQHVYGAAGAGGPVGPAQGMGQGQGVQRPQQAYGGYAQYPVQQQATGQQQTQQQGYGREGEWTNSASR
ncbi:hypothetical protein BCR44DRAFT_64403 [Catenaria anguillulae PL171]|uniref:Transmembrane protein n=1 Tax=Catenaria anguillulae PL171 TaxID=765915 RepID=A0A1Y2H633_9FUNG|nr:hypothetical protein BCR44DRAFT_64403 [Catenaria anguillulae PL171]